MNPYLIGVAGPSCSGKSCLAAHLAARLNAQGPQQARGCAAVLSLDSYYRPLDHLTPHQRTLHNFDMPEALDSELILDHLRLLQQGQPVLCPVYDLATHTRRAEIVELAPRPFVIIEGIFAFYWESLRASLATKVYVDLDEQLCLERRIERDARERGRSRESVITQYRATVAPMARRYVYPARAHADLLLSGSAEGLFTPGESEFSRQVEAILHHIHARAQDPAHRPSDRGNSPQD